MSKTTKQFKDLKVGDKIRGSDGSLKRITNVYETHTPEEMYELTIGDMTIEASGNHLWYTETKEDEANRMLYEQLSINYFLSEDLSRFDKEVNTAYPKDILAEKLSNSEESYKFIEMVCDTVGHTYDMLNIHFEGYMDFTGENFIHVYSYEDILKYLKEMSDNLTNEDYYFRFGKIRTTKEIYELMVNGYVVYIPTVDELSQSNRR